MLTIREYKKSSRSRKRIRSTRKVQPRDRRHDLAQNGDAECRHRQSTCPVWDWTPSRKPETEFRIGAIASLRALELHEGLAAYTNGAMRESVRHIVGVQLRNLATVGGSLYSRFGFSDVLTMFPRAGRTGRAVQRAVLCRFPSTPKDPRTAIFWCALSCPRKCEIQLPVRAHQPDRYSGADLCVR